MSSQTLSPARLEAFSDGVIAVIITIMVLELKVPEHLEGIAGLRAIFPTLFLYLLSFVQVGIYWVNHHYLLDEAESVSHWTLWANLIFLFCLSLFPFATAWVGSKGLTSFAVALYAFTSLLPGFSYTLLWMAVRSRSTTPAHTSWYKQFSSVSLYILAIPTAFYSPRLSLAIMVFVAFLWILPPPAEIPPEGDFCHSPERVATRASRKV